MSASHDDISGFGALGPTGNGETLIASHASNLAIDLIWDPSVASAPKAFFGAVDAAAKMLVSLLNTATPTVVYVDVGWGEVNGPGGGPLGPGVLGESNATVAPYAFSDVVAAMAAHGDNMSTAQTDVPALGLDGFPVAVATAEAKALGLPVEIATSAAAPDGAIGFGDTAGLAATNNSWNFDPAGTRATQYNLQAIALHELTEVMGRLGSEGFTYPALAPLDLLTFSAPGELALVPLALGQFFLGTTPEYFSTDNGVTQMGQFNPYAFIGAGDVGDWAVYPSVRSSGTLPGNLQDAFDAGFKPGYNLALSLDDIAEMVALGY
jgi:hypothetical protein